MGNTESKDCLYCGSSIISCSSSSSNNYNCCDACCKKTPPTTAICHDKSFSVTERSSLSDIIGYVYDFCFYVNNYIMTLLTVLLFWNQSGITVPGAAEDPPPKKKSRPSKATKLEQLVMPVPTLLELDKEISDYKGCGDSSCFKDCRGGCFGKNFVTNDGDIWSDSMKLVLQLFRTKTRNKSKEELESYCVELFKTHCTNLHNVVNSTLTSFEELYGGGDRASSSTSATMSSSSSMGKQVGSLHDHSDRFTHDCWSVELDSSTFLPSGKKHLQLCRHSFSFLYGLKPNTMKRIAKVMKDIQSSEIKSAKQEKPFDHRSYFGQEYSLNDIQAIFDANGLDVGVSEARSGLVRASFAHIDAYLWMENYFYQFEHQPNSKEIHIDATWKVSIYSDYLASASTINESKVSLGAFKEIWLALFDIVKIRKIKRVSSKCWTCAYINEIRNKQKGDQVIITYYLIYFVVFTL